MNRRDLARVFALGVTGLVLPAATANGLPRQASTERLPWQHAGETLRLAIRRRPADGPAVVYVHGATFPSASSVGWRIHGISWLDQLQNAGFDAWAFDFAGYGGSDRPSVFELDADASPAYGRSEVAAAQLLAVLRHIRRIRPATPIHLIAHSWGTIPARLVAGQHPELVERLVLFGPVVQRQNGKTEESRQIPAWQLVTAAQQRPRYRTGMPEDLSSPVSNDEQQRWCQAYLRSDPQAVSREPTAVKVPGGPAADVGAMFSGHALVDDGLIQQPTLIIRGEWDHLTGDADAARLFSALAHASDKRDVKISGGNHWLHLQPRRTALWAETTLFLGE